MSQDSWTHLSLPLYRYTHLCGFQPDQESITTHLSVSSVVIRFHTDETYNHRGFNITYNFKGTYTYIHTGVGGGGLKREGGKSEL